MRSLILAACMAAFLAGCSNSGAASANGDTHQTVTERASTPSSMPSMGGGGGY